MHALSLHHAGIDGVDANIPRSELFRQRFGHSVDRRLCCAVNGPRGWCRGACHRADVNDVAAVCPEAIHRLLRAVDEAENIEIKQSVKMLFRYGFEREEFVNTGVVNQYVESPNACFVSAKRRSMSACGRTSRRALRVVVHLSKTP
jgi:hypothetical protein